MIEEGQLLERFRALSRNLQNSIQTIEKLLNDNTGTIPLDLKAKCDAQIKIARDSWQEYSEWVLISTLDDLSVARANCAPGLVNIKSKLQRAKARYNTTYSAKRLVVDIKQCHDATFSTYIQYFEQCIDLLLENAIKYSPRNGIVEVSSRSINDSIEIEISSIGPIVETDEIQNLGSKEFRSKAAKLLNVPGQGFGLYNVKRLCGLLESSVRFYPKQIPKTTIDNTDYGPFSVVIKFPITLQPQ